MSKFKVWLFRLIFTDRQEQYIINALYRRSNDYSTDSNNDEQHIRDYCHQLATKLMRS